MARSRGPQTVVSIRKIQKPLDLPLRKKTGDGTVEFRPGHDHGRIIIANPSLEAILEKRPDGGQLADDGRLGKAPVVKIRHPAAQNDVIDPGQADFSAVKISGHLEKIAPVGGHGMGRGVSFIPEVLEELIDVFAHASGSGAAGPVSF
jgi:hypothetical protein